jgi:hypothetical protein
MTPRNLARLRSTSQLRSISPGPAETNDDTLTIMLVRLYASDMDRHMSLPNPTATRRACTEAILRRMIDGELRCYISRLVRDIYLSDNALQAGLGVEEAFEFWQWFDRTMWPAPSSWD